MVVVGLDFVSWLCVCLFSDLVCEVFLDLIASCFECDRYCLCGLGVGSFLQLVVSCMGVACWFAGSCVLFVLFNSVDFVFLYDCTLVGFGFVVV